MNNTQVVILAGGKGTRLNSLTVDTPKPMIQVNETPFLEILLQMFYQKGFRNFVLLTGYLSNIIIDYFGDGSKFGIDIQYSVEHELLGTAGGLKNIEKILAEEFLLINGDTYLDIDFNDFIKFSKLQNNLCSIVCYTDNLFDDVGYNLKLDEKHFISEYSKTLKNKEFNAVDAGVYYMKKEIVKIINNTKSSLESEVFPELISQKKISGFETKTRFFDIGTVERIEKLEHHLSSTKYYKKHEVI